MERERDTHLESIDRDQVEDAVPSTGGIPAAEAETAAEEERHRRVMVSAERVMRMHRDVFAALAK